LSSINFSAGGNLILIKITESQRPNSQPHSVHQSLGDHETLSLSRGFLISTRINANPTANFRQKQSSHPGMLGFVEGLPLFSL
jgi:hypothetical protein